MIKLPYAISSFHRIRSEGYTYIDRTHYIPLLEEAGRQLVFLRPRRFGKSLLLSMLGQLLQYRQSGRGKYTVWPLAHRARPDAGAKPLPDAGTGFFRRVGARRQ